MTGTVGACLGKFRTAPARATKGRVFVAALMVQTGLPAAAAGESTGADTVARVNYIGDAWANVAGGIEEGERYLSNLHLSARLPVVADGAGGSRLYVSALYNSGVFFSGDLVGDTQIVSNIEASDATRIYEMNYEYVSSRGHTSWLVGLWDLNSEIDVIEPAGLFINSSHGIGAEFATSGRNGPSIFPITSLALRWRQRLSDTLTLRTAILDGVPGNPNNPERPRARFQLGSGDGALVVSELDYALPSQWRAKLGLWGYTIPRPFLTSGAQTIDELSDREESGPAMGVYGSVYGALSDTGPWGSLDTFLRIGVANGEVQQIASYLGAGLVLRGFAGGVTGEQLGFAIAHARSGTTSQRLGDALHETSLEFTIGADITPWLRVQPNLQYVMNPGFDRRRDDAVVVGVRFELTTGFEF